MTRRFIGILIAATVLSAIPAFAQDPAAHDAHHPAGEATPTAPTAPGPPAVPATPQAPGMTMSGMDCMKMMEGMMRGGMMTGAMMSGGATTGESTSAAPTMPMQGGMPMAGGKAMPGRMGIAGAADAPASTKAYRIAAERMHIGMAADYSGNADADFVRGMMAHHRGAIEMAEVVLEHGNDPELRKLAEGVIAAQEAEIAVMRKWLLDHRPAKP